MVMIQKDFVSYDNMIKYLSKIERVDKASFEFKDGFWILNIVKFDR